ncbi:MAG: response regulator [Methylocystis sp.]|uniref:response regulator n=1 Tax=Methylocystis sp. TaxID=1911079 RepID=UPI003DA28682
MSHVEGETSGCRVLLVETDPHYGISFKQAVAEARSNLKLEIELEHVEDGLAAVYLVSQYYLTETLPHAVVVDLDMLHSKARDFLSALRNHPLLKDLPVLGLTSSTAPAFYEEMTAAGVDRVFAKPTDPRALLRVATEMLGLHCPIPEDQSDRVALAPHAKSAGLAPALTDYVAAMNLIAKTTKNFSCPPVYVNPADEGSHYIWVEEILEAAEGGNDVPERRARFIETLRLLFEAWCAGGTPEGEELRNQAKSAYQKLSREEKELWGQQAATH